MDDLGSTSPFATVNESGGIDYAQMNKGITPIFFIEAIPDDKATEAAGAVRMYEQEMVRIQVAGDMLNVATAPVDSAIKERFAAQYEAFKTKRQARHIEGTPLKNWPMISALRIAEFEAVGIFSVENLAAVSDTNVVKLADGRVWREKAAAWLASAKDNAVSVKYAAENERLRNDLEEMRKQIAELSAKVDDPEAKRGPGRPRKEAA
jgi:hypothetical protein